MPEHVSLLLVVKELDSFKEFDVAGVKFYVIPSVFKYITIVWHFIFSNKVYQNSCVDVLFSPGGFNLSTFKKSVVMCRNSLFFDNESITLYNFKNRIQLFIKRWLSIYSYRNSTETIFISKHARNSIVPILGNRTRTSLIHHGISTDFREKWFKPEIKETVNFVYTSAFEPYKLHLELLNILEQLVDNSNYYISLTCIGSQSHTGYYNRVQEKLNCITSDIDYIELSGLSHSEMLNVYRASHVFIFPSMCENMPNALLEAKSYGMPVVAFSRSGTAEFLEDHDVLIDPFDVDSSVKQIIELIEQYKELELPKSNHSFTWEKTINETYKVIECADLTDL